MKKFLITNIRVIVFRYIFGLIAIYLVLWGSMAIGKFIFPDKFLMLNYFIYKGAFRELENHYSKPWNSVFLCTQKNGEVLINYRAVDLFKVNGQEASKIFSSYQVDLLELTKLMKQIDGLCFFGEKQFFQIESDLGSMDYHVGYVFFYNSLKKEEREVAFEKNFSYKDLHYENVTLKNISGNWYVYTFVE